MNNLPFKDVFVPYCYTYLWAEVFSTTSTLFVPLLILTCLPGPFVRLLIYKDHIVLIYVRHKELSSTLIPLMCFSRWLLVGNSSVSVNPTLCKNEKVEHRIRMKTHKLILLRFWVGSGVNPLYWLDSGFIGIVSPNEFSHRNRPISGIKAFWFEAIFTCLRDWGKYKNGFFEIYKLLFMEWHYERLFIF